MADKEQERPVFHPGLGELLKGLREALGWSVQQTVNIAAGKGMHALTPNKLRWLEEGKTKLPDPDLLRAVAALYEQDYTELATAFIGETYGEEVLKAARSPKRAKQRSDLIRHKGELKTNLPPDSEVAVDPASARIRELETRIDELEMYKLIVEHLRPVLTDVLELVGNTVTLVGGKGDQAAASPTGRRRHPRKVD